MLYRNPRTTVTVLLLCLAAGASARAQGVTFNQAETDHARPAASPLAPSGRDLTGLHVNAPGGEVGSRILSNDFPFAGLFDVSSSSLADNDGEPAPPNPGGFLPPEPSELPPLGFITPPGPSFVVQSVIPSSPPTPNPEPGTWLLMGVSTLGLGALAYRKYRARRDPRADQSDQA